MKKIYPSENEILKLILEWLALKGYFAWRNNSGAYKTESGGFVRFGCAGSPDIFAILRPSGRFLGIEVKAHGRKQTVYQQIFEENMKNNGAVYLLAYSLEDVIDKICI